MALNHEQQTHHELSRTNQSQLPSVGSVSEGGRVPSSTAAADSDLSMDILAMIESTSLSKLMPSIGECVYVYSVEVELMLWLLALVGLVYRV